MTIDATANDHLPRRGAVAGQIILVVKVTNMKNCLMTGLAKIGRLAYQKGGVIRTVRVMTERTVFTNRGVVEDLRSAFFRVALITNVIGGSELQLTRTDAAVRIVTVVARHAAFAQRHMLGALQLGLLTLMTARANLGTGCGTRRVNRVAIVASEAGGIVCAGAPMGAAIGLMALQAHAIARRFLRRAKVFQVQRPLIVFAAHNLKVTGAGSVASFAALLCELALRVMQQGLAMRAAFQSGPSVFVAGLTFFPADVGRREVLR